jgi:phosphate-selective porin
MKYPILTAITAAGVVAAAPIAVQAAPAPSTLEQVVHANVRIMHGGAIAGDTVPFSAFERTNISAADILNRQELYHVSPNVVPAAPGYEMARNTNVTPQAHGTALTLRSVPVRKS